MDKDSTNVELLAIFTNHFPTHHEGSSTIEHTELATGKTRG